MADAKITELTNYTSPTTSADVLPIVDTTNSATKKITLANFLSYIGAYAQTITNKTISFGSNTVSATLAQLNTAISDANVASLDGSETLTNKTLTTPVIASISNGGTVTVPSGVDTLVARTSTDTLSNKTLTAPKFVDTGFIADENGNEQIKFSTTASAVNEVTVKNAATGGAPDIQATGGDTNIDLKLTPKGTGKVAPQAGVNHGAFTAYFTETDNGNSSTADTIDWTLSNKQKSTLTGNCTFTFTAPPGPCSLILKLVQDATGSRTVTWPAAVHWSGGTAPTLTTTASKVDIICFYYDGSTYFGTSSLNYTA